MYATDAAQAPTKARYPLDPDLQVDGRARTATSALDTAKLDTAKQ